MFISLPYVSLVFVLFLHEYMGKIRGIHRGHVKILNYFILIIFFCFRGYIFTDVLNYYDYFMNVKTLDYIIVNFSYLKWQWWEPGFVIYMSFFKTLCNNYFFYQFFDSLIDLIILYKCLEWFDSNDSFSLMIFLTVNGMIIFFDLQRNVKSLLLFFYAIRYIESGEWKKYYTVLFFAWLFHNTALVYFLFYPFSKIRLTRKRFVCCCCCSMFFAFFSSKFLKFFLSKLSFFLPGRLLELAFSYITDSAVSGFLSFGVLEKIIMIILLTVYFDRLFINKNEIMIKIYLIYILLYFSFFYVRVLSERMSMLFVFSYWILVPALMKLQKREYKIIFSLFVLLYCVLKTSLYSQPQDLYENWLFGPVSSIKEREMILKKFIE